MAIYESVLASPHRTLNGDEADYFFVPVLDSCIITRADDAPHLSMEVKMWSLFALIACGCCMTPITGAYSTIFLYEQSFLCLETINGLLYL